MRAEGANSDYPQPYGSTDSELHHERGDAIGSDSSRCSSLSTETPTLSDTTNQTVSPLLGSDGGRFDRLGCEAAPSTSHNRQPVADLRVQATSLALANGGYRSGNGLNSRPLSWLGGQTQRHEEISSSPPLYKRFRSPTRIRKLISPNKLKLSTLSRSSAFSHPLHHRTSSHIFPSMPHGKEKTQGLPLEGTQVTLQDKMMQTQPISSTLPNMMALTQTSIVLDKTCAENQEWQLKMARSISQAGITTPIEVGNYLCSINKITRQIEKRAMRFQDPMTKEYYWVNLVDGKRLWQDYDPNEPLFGQPVWGIAGNLLTFRHHSHYPVHPPPADPWHYPRPSAEEFTPAFKEFAVDGILCAARLPRDMRMSEWRPKLRPVGDITEQQNLDRLPWGSHSCDFLHCEEMRAA